MRPTILGASALNALAHCLAEASNQSQLLSGLPSSQYSIRNNQNSRGRINEAEAPSPLVGTKDNRSSAVTACPAAPFYTSLTQTEKRKKKEKKRETPSVLLHSYGTASYPPEIVMVYKTMET